MLGPLCLSYEDPDLESDRSTREEANSEECSPEKSEEESTDKISSRYDLTPV